MRVCVCVWIELEISSKRIKVLENERFWVLFWGGGNQNNNHGTRSGSSLLLFVI